MKYVVFFGAMIVFIAGHSLAADYLDSYEIIPASPKAGESFVIRLNGTWPNDCPSGTVRAPLIYQGTIYLEIYVSVPSGPCETVVTPWSYDITIPAQPKGLYSVKYHFSSSKSAYNTLDMHLTTLKIGLPDIKKCEVTLGNGVLETSGGWDGSGFGVFLVTGTFSFVDTGNDGWLTEIELQADDRDNRVGDIAELFRLGPVPVDMKNNSYTSFFGSNGKSSLTIEELGADQIKLTGVFQESLYDGYQYDLTCTANIIEHSFCHKLPAGDANKDCKVDIRDLAIMAYEWLDCQLLDQGDCTQ